MTKWLCVKECPKWAPLSLAMVMICRTTREPWFRASFFCLLHQHVPSTHSCFSYSPASTFCVSVLSKYALNDHSSWWLFSAFLVNKMDCSKEVAMGVGGVYDDRHPHVPSMHSCFSCSPASAKKLVSFAETPPKIMGAAHKMWKCECENVNFWARTSSLNFVATYRHSVFVRE